MGLRTLILLACFAISRYAAKGPALLLYDTALIKSPREQLIMADLVTRDLLIQFNYPFMIPVEIQPRLSMFLLFKNIFNEQNIGPNRTIPADFFLFTKRPVPPQYINGLPAHSANKSLIWLFNIEPACSKGFKRSRLRRSLVDDFSELIIEARNALQSSVQENVFVCSRDQWKKQTVLVGAVEIEPFSTRYEFNGTVKWKGSDIDLFETIAKHIGFRYIYVEPQDRSYGLPVNMSGNGLIGMGFRGEIDIAAYVCVYDAQPFFDMVWPTIYGETVLLIPSPTFVYDLLSNLKPFNIPVWICIVVSLLSVSIMMWTVAQFFGLPSDVGLDLLYNIALVTGQGGFNPKYLPGRFLATAWNLGAFVVILSYTSILISFITARQPQPLMSKVDDFVTKKSLKPVAGKGLVFSKYFLEGETGIRKQIGDIFRSNPETITQTHAQALNMVLSGGYGYITVKLCYSSLSLMKTKENEKGTQMADTSISTDFHSSKQCRLMIVKTDEFGVRLVGWNTSKLVPTLTKILHQKYRLLRKHILWATEAGLIIKSERNYLPQISCFQMESFLDTAVETPIRLVQLQTAFLLLGIGLGASLFCFAREVILVYYTMR